MSAIEAQATAFLEAWFATRRVVQALNFNRFQQEGLSATQFIVLSMLGDADGELSPAQIARALQVNVTTTMRTARTLETRGLIERGSDPSDARRSVLRLTTSGRAMHRRLHRAFVERIVAAFAAMPSNTRSGLVRGLEAFVAASEAASR